MSAVVCHYGWNEKRIEQLAQWAKGDGDRHIVILEDAPAVRFFESPNIRHYSISPENEEETFRRIAYEHLFVPFSFEGKKCEKLERIQAEVNYFVSDYADQGISLLKNLLENLKRPALSGLDLFGKFAGVPAIVCGAGPSLAKAGLRAFSDRALLIAGGAAIDALKRLSLRPHFAAHVDPDPKHTFASTDAPVFCQLRTSTRVLKGCRGPKLLVPGSGNFPLEKWIEEQLGFPEAPFDGGWTVGTFSAALAYCLGCDPIVFVGMDLSSSQKNLYASGVETPCATDALVPVQNGKGETVYARLDWLLARDWIEAFAKKHPDRRWINASEGLAFSGMEHKRLADVELSVREISIALPEAVLEGGAVLEHIEEGLRRSLDLVEKLLKELEAIFPKTESGAASLLQHDLSQELIYEKVLKPVWDVWKPIIARHNRNGEYGLMLNELILQRNLVKEALSVQSTIKSAACTN